MQKLLVTATLFLLAPLTRAQTPTILPLPDIHSQQQLDATILALAGGPFTRGAPFMPAHLGHEWAAHTARIHLRAKIPPCRAA